MKFLRYRQKKTTSPQLGISTQKGIIPLSALRPDAPVDMVEFIKSPAWNELRLSPLPANPPTIDSADIEFLAPIERPGKILCVGLNYRDHVLEGGREIPEYPTLFLKASSSVIGHLQAILLPNGSQMSDFEAELAVVIGAKTYQCSAENAYDHIAGYTIMNDVSERDYQNRTSQWTMGKSCDTFAPIGPVIVTRDEITDPHTLDIKGSLNGFQMQSSNTGQLIFTIPFLIEYISSLMTLEPGDIISTGTPGGVGVFREPPIFLNHGDEINITIEGIGSLINNVQ